MTQEKHQTVESASSPEVIALRHTNDEVPETFAAYAIEKVVVTDQSSAQNDVQVQNYDPDDSNVDEEVYVSVASDDTETLGAESDSDVLTVPRGNQIRVAVEGDADVTLYIDPDSL